MPVKPIGPRTTDGAPVDKQLICPDDGYVTSNELVKDSETRSAGKSAERISLKEMQERIHKIQEKRALRERRRAAFLKAYENENRDRLVDSNSRVKIAREL